MKEKYPITSPKKYGDPAFANAILKVRSAHHFLLPIIMPLSSIHFNFSLSSRDFLQVNLHIAKLKTPRQPLQYNLSSYQEFQLETYLAKIQK
jgi:hypothetical protein